MKGIILLNGEPYLGEINADGALVYCCDGAYGWAKGKVRIDENVGDFDSLDEIPNPPPKLVYPSEKDFTDGEIALKKLLETGVGEIEIYGGGGGREDHFIGNLHLLYRAFSDGVRCTMFNNNAVIFAASGSIPLGEYCGKTFSVLPFGAPLHIIESEGLKYSYPENLSYGECRGISNIVVSASARLNVIGTALIIINGGTENDHHLYKTAQTNPRGFKENLPQMKYVDLHCDTLTVCSDGGYSLSDCNLQTSLEKLKKSGCAAQCFAIFTDGESSASRFKNYLGFYTGSLQTHGVKAVLDYNGLVSCLSSGETGAILTVENLGFISDLSELTALHAAGVRMASLVWNNENSFAYPNLIFRGGKPAFSERESRGLKLLGRQAVEMLESLKIIIDVSHLSDGGTEEILKTVNCPVVASHSNAYSVCGVSRNLTDGLIKKIASGGGVIGVNFCKDFLGGKDVYQSVLNHLKHIINVGGEDAAALGSDFDGIPPAAGLEDCTKMPALFDYLLSNGISYNCLEKIRFKNFARVFRTVCG